MPQPNKDLNPARSVVSPIQFDREGFQQDFGVVGWPTHQSSYSQGLIGGPHKGVSIYGDHDEGPERRTCHQRPGHKIDFLT